MNDEKGIIKSFDTFWNNLRKERRKFYSEGDILRYQEMYAYLGCKVIEKNFPQARDALSIECGCGKGDTSLFFSKRGFRTVLQDVSMSGLRIASNNFKEESVPCKLVQGDIFNLSFKGNTFDVVFNLGLLEHIDDIGAVTREMIRILKPGGTFFVSIARTNRFNIQKFVDVVYHIPGTTLINLFRLRFDKIINNVRSYIYPVIYENRYSVEEYEQFFSANGLKDIKIIGTGPFPYLKLNRNLEKMYIFSILAISKFLQLIGKEEPFTINTKIARTWYIFGTK